MIGPDRSRSDRFAAPSIPFSRVNRPGSAGYVPGLQRHHLIPRVLTQEHWLRPLLRLLGEGAGLDDFRRNGILLPANERGAVRMGLPLHRGPHRVYSAMVAERLGEIERLWSLDRRTGPAAVRLAGLQAALRRELLSPRRTWKLNARDPLGSEADFAQLDAMADSLWAAVQPRNGAVSAERAAIAA